MDLLELFEYQIWADNVIINDLSKLDEGTLKQEYDECSSIKELVNRLTINLATWYHRLRGLSPDPLPDFLDLDTKVILEKWQVFNLKLFEIFSIRSEGLFKYETAFGQTYENSIQDVGFHLINHTTAWRSQIILLLNLYRKNVMDTDFLTYKANQLLR